MKYYDNNKNDNTVLLFDDPVPDNYISEDWILFHSTNDGWVYYLAGENNYHCPLPDGVVYDVYTNFGKFLKNSIADLSTPWSLVNSFRPVVTQND